MNTYPEHHNTEYDEGISFPQQPRLANDDPRVEEALQSIELSWREAINDEPVPCDLITAYVQGLGMMSPEDCKRAQDGVIRFSTWRQAVCDLHYFGEIKPSTKRKITEEEVVNLMRNLRRKFGKDNRSLPAPMINIDGKTFTSFSRDAYKKETEWYQPPTKKEPYPISPTAQVVIENSIARGDVATRISDIQKDVHALMPHTKPSGNSVARVVREVCGTLKSHFQKSVINDMATH